MMREKMWAFVPVCLIVVLCLTGAVAWAETDSDNDRTRGEATWEVVTDDIAVLFLGREVIYDVGRGFCPNGYKEGNFDGEGDAPDCRMKYLMAQGSPPVVSPRRI